MPYNPVLKYPEVIKKLNSENRFLAAKLFDIQNAVIAILGSIDAKKIARHMEIMERLGYIRKRMDTAFDLCMDGKPHNFHESANPEIEADQLLAKVESSEVEK